MNKTVRVSLIVMIAVGLLLALTISGLAKKPDTFHLEYVFPEVNWEIFYAEGTFDLEVFDGRTTSGDAFVHWIPRLSSVGTGLPVKQGTMTFIDGDADRAVVRFSMSKIEANFCVSGHFDILYGQGTGKYENLDGGGDILMCRPDWGPLVEGELNGWAQGLNP